MRGLYLILDDDTRNAERLVHIARVGALAGVRIMQYRAKAGVDRALLGRLCAAAHSGGARLIVNDDWQAARELNADGVHLGQEDAARLDLGALRAALGSHLLGISCGTPQEVRAAAAAGADYAGVGAVYATSSKADAGVPIGLAGLRAAVSACTLPIVAIGGISAANIAAVARTGAAMAAVISAVAAAPDAGRAAAELVRCWQDASA